MDQNLPPLQPLPAQNNKFRKYPFPIFIVLLLLLIGMGGILIIFLIKESTVSNKEVINKISVIGVVRTSGLSVAEKKTLGLNFSDFQIELFNVDTSKENAIYGYFLESAGNNIGDYVGKCVNIEDEKGEPPGFNIVNAYRRSVIKAEKINLLSINDCTPYSATLGRIDFSQVKLIVMEGIVERMTRPVPDIGYDYELKLRQPYIDSTSSTGSTQKLSTLSLVPSTNDQWMVFENNIGREMTLEGSVLWGYAESKYFGVTEIKKIGNESFVDSKGWKTYTNPVQYYSISYPAGFSVNLDKDHNPPELHVNITNPEGTIVVDINDGQGTLSGNSSGNLIPLTGLEFTINGRTYKPEEAYDFSKEGISERYKRERYRFAKLYPILAEGKFWNYHIDGSYAKEEDLEVVKNIISTFTFLYPSLDGVNKDGSTWKTFLPPNNFTYNTTDWAEFREDGFPISYSFKYPPELRVSGGGLSLGRDGIASITGPIHLSPGQTCFQNRKIYNKDTKELSSEEINFGDIRGIRVLDEVKLPGDIHNSYESAYCLWQEDKAIIISFNGIDVSFPQRKLFEQILATFKFQ